MAQILTLSEYLQAVTKRRWQIGVLDCSTFMADWLVLSGRRDPIADVRGTYSTERQFLRIVRGEGGFETACAARLSAIGMHETLEPVPGDLVAVAAPYAVRRGQVQRRATGAICAGPKRNAVVTPDLGLVIAGFDRLPVIKAWTF